MYRESKRDWCRDCDSDKTMERCNGCAVLDVKQSGKTVKGYVVGRPDCWVEVTCKSANGQNNSQ
jgi:hypothetical protein